MLLGFNVKKKSYELNILHTFLKCCTETFQIWLCLITNKNIVFIIWNSEHFLKKLGFWTCFIIDKLLKEISGNSTKVKPEGRAQKWCRFSAVTGFYSSLNMFVILLKCSSFAQTRIRGSDHQRRKSLTRPQEAARITFSVQQPLCGNRA